MPDGLDFYAHLLFGADSDDHREELRQEWEAIGRKYFMHPGWIHTHPHWYGNRPMSFWAFEWTTADHPDCDCRVQAECILKHNLCDEIERKAIIERQIVAQQLGLYVAPAPPVSSPEN